MRRLGDLPPPGDRGSSTEKLALLYGFVRAVQPRTAVETGTYRGAAAIAIGTALEENGFGHLLTMDPANHQVRDHFFHLDLEPWVTYLQVDAGEVLEKLPTLDFAYIDCAWDTRRRHFELARERLTEGGVIVVDDVLHEHWPKHGKEEERDAIVASCQVVLPAFHGLAIYVGGAK